MMRMAHGKTIQKEKGAYKFFPTNGSLLTTQIKKTRITPGGQLRKAPLCIANPYFSAFASIFLQNGISVSIAQYQHN